jgi:hypothetical protein
MICAPFLVPAQIDQTNDARCLPDTGCNTYAMVDSRYVRRHSLQRLEISKRKIWAYDDRPGEDVEAVVKMHIDIGGVCRVGWAYEVKRMKDQDLILGLPWLRDVSAIIEPDGPSLAFPELSI